MNVCIVAGTVKQHTLLCYVDPMPKDLVSPRSVFIKNKQTNNKKTATTTNPPHECAEFLTTTHTAICQLNNKPVANNPIKKEYNH